MSIVCAVGLVLFVAPGVLLYVRLYFVPLILIDETIPPLRALRRSFALTRGYVGPLFVLVLTNTFIQLASLPTVIGAIPVTGFASTARAEAFRRLSAVHEEPLSRGARSVEP